MSLKLSFLLCALILALPSPGSRLLLAQSVSAAPRPVKVSDRDASALIIDKEPPTFPEAAIKSGIQGSVVLKLVVAQTGEVKDVSIISGNPILAQAASDAVKKWKYKPYTVDGAPVEMETEVSINFHLKSSDHAPPQLGTFQDQTYSNDFFEFSFPLSRDWVSETQLMRSRVAQSAQSSGMYVLLAAVHIPQQTTVLEADSSFVLSALQSGGNNCQQYLSAVANNLQSHKQAQGRGTIAPVTFGGRAFYRADFVFKERPNHRTFICTESKNYLLQWNIDGLSDSAVDSAVTTLKAIGAAKSDTDSVEPLTFPNGGHIPRVKVAQGTSEGLRIKAVQPVYPDQARRAHIQGTVKLNAVINKTGDVEDLEVLDGPIDLVVSAVNAVRQWKYQPYSTNGKPVEVSTEITVHYSLSPF